jgi:hypothetical protein
MECAFCRVRGDGYFQNLDARTMAVQCVSGFAQKSNKFTQRVKIEKLSATIKSSKQHP